jgi:hypothetical protein
MLPQKELRQSITEFWISLTDKVLLQPFNESERQRADPPRLSAATAVRLWAGPVPTTGAAVSTGPRRKLREIGHASKSVVRHIHTKTVGITKVDHGRRARTEAWPEPNTRGFRTTLPGLKRERAAPPHQMLPQKELRQSLTEFWISLTDSVQLRWIK